jgi:nucleoside-diphosphate-sugar epimerase
MRIFVIGAAGGIGRRLTAFMTAAGDEVSGMHRRSEQAATIRSAGGTPVSGDLIEDSVDVLAGRIRGHAAVVFSAGAHGTGMDQTTLIDGEGVKKAAAAALAAGVRRLVLVSAIPESGRGVAQPVERFEHYMGVKKAADAFLVAQPLDWVIVRPGALTDEPGSGLVHAGPALVADSVSRDNVAAFLAAVLHEPRLSHAIVEVTDGDIPVAQAVQDIVRLPDH